ncbi:MAG TPA: hypothetical protein VK851_11940 [Anaerolineales bacterium]|nr:hypothetical protein [Anaerolineales bacterium]
MITCSKERRAINGHHHLMLVDDHTMVRQGLATFLKVFDDLELAASRFSPNWGR